MSATDVPCIVQMQQMMRGKTDVLSLAQGIVHWAPPESALAAGRAAMTEPDSSLYGPDDGLLALREALKAKLQAENGISQSEVMVTAGANQGYTNIVLTLMDAGDAAMLFRPYYFNHLMALQMTGSAGALVLPPSLPDLQPDVSALQRELEERAASASTPQLKLVTLVNPGNPTGVMIPRATLEEASALCARHGVWLVIDNTYEHFAYKDCPPHECIEGEHIINLFSFSKAFGMMGWRVGYIAFPPKLGAELFKVQDTIGTRPARDPYAPAVGIGARAATTLPLHSLTLTSAGLQRSAQRSRRRSSPSALCPAGVDGSASVWMASRSKRLSCSMRSPLSATGPSRAARVPSTCFASCPTD